MKTPLVIDYTELDFPVDGIKHNEGYVLAEALRRSRFDHLAVSTGYRYNEHSIIPRQHGRQWKDQHGVAREALGAEVIHPGGGQQGIFDFEEGWFVPGFLESRLEEYDYLILNLNSLDPRNLKVADRIRRLSDNVKVVYSVHNPRLYDMGEHEGTDWQEVFGQMDAFISFSPGIAEGLGLPADKVHEVRMGVDESVYGISGESDGLVVATNVLHSYQRFHPFNLMAMNGLLSERPEARVVLDYSDMNRPYVEGFEVFAPWRQEGRIIEADFLHDLVAGGHCSHMPLGYSASNPLQGADAFFSCYKTKEMDVNILKALMSGVPVIVPENDYHDGILDGDNSVTYPAVGVDYDDCPQYAGNARPLQEGIARLLTFGKGSFDGKRIRQRLISGGYTSARMIAELDSIYQSLG